MHDYAPALLATSAAIVLVLGSIHLYFTFFSNKFSPRDAELEARMKEISPLLTRETTMWRALVGFNASHSLGAMLFGVIYAYLAIFQPSVLFQSRFLLLVGFLFLASFVVLARRYWFSVPFRGIALSAILYLTALGLHWT
jgi:hypothetical protein